MKHDRRGYLKSPFKMSDVGEEGVLAMKRMIRSILKYLKATEEQRQERLNQLSLHYAAAYLGRAELERTKA